MLHEEVGAVNIPRDDRRNERPYHHGNLRAAIVEAGIAALADGGEVTIRDLARRIGVSPNAAYRHFEDKDALLAALATEGFRRFSAEVAVAPAPDARTSLREYGRGYVRFARANPALFRLMFGPLSAIAPSDELASVGMAGFQTLLANVAALLGVESSDPRVGVGATFAWSVVHGLSALALDNRLDGIAGHYGGVDDLVDLVLDVTVDAGSARTATTARD